MINTIHNKKKGKKKDYNYYNRIILKSKKILNSIIMVGWANFILFSITESAFSALCFNLKKLNITKKLDVLFCRL